jgi:putative PIN family toxin of toxin-antitoxin system
MPLPSRVVIDTNVLVSALLSSTSLPSQAVILAAGNAILLASQATLEEIQTVLLRDRFTRWLSVETRTQFLAGYRHTVQVIPVVSHLEICRDPRDNKFLDVAVDGRADSIVTGDEDLLALGPFRGIRIVTPQQFLAL